MVYTFMRYGSEHMSWCKRAYNKPSLAQLAHLMSLKRLLDLLLAHSERRVSPSRTRCEPEPARCARAFFQPIVVPLCKFTLFFLNMYAGMALGGVKPFLPSLAQQQQLSLPPSPAEPLKSARVWAILL
jgi:hypothetical protein